jgi:hypothetical protein
MPTAVNRHHHDHSSDDEILETTEEHPIKFTELIVISHEAWFYTVFAIINTAFSLASSYYYLWMAAFGMHLSDIVFLYSSLSIEGYFIISMIIKFLTDYTV